MKAYKELNGETLTQEQLESIYEHQYSKIIEQKEIDKTIIIYDDLSPSQENSSLVQSISGEKQNKEKKVECYMNENESIATLKIKDYTSVKANTIKDNFYSEENTPIDEGTTTKITTMLQKKTGRKAKDDDDDTKEYTYHSFYSSDNIRDKSFRYYLDSTKDAFNANLKKGGNKLELTNYKQQNSNCAQSEFFLGLKLYNYFSYNTYYPNNDNQNHKKIGSYNMQIIKEIIKEPEKNKICFAILKSNIEYMYNKFINNIKTITINGNECDLLNFKTLNDVAEIEKAKIMAEKKLSEQNIDEYIEKFKETASSLIAFIKNKKNQRKDFKKIKYTRISELEE